MGVVLRLHFVLVCLFVYGSPGGPVALVSCTCLHVCAAVVYIAHVVCFFDLLFSTNV